ncbi:ABC transporter permease [Gordonia soli]|uniref:Putative ABC transporter permease protein n=1 Tax=Gordonia soli NBRC 108243 TaxID=1223545 RepID=M0QJ30_9ACTN|nr:ABC transporter permease [Gordonia soli]GAC68444.1 putative ABC transporter permease protein [Gordonia soli NBRC 108243]
MTAHAGGATVTHRRHPLRALATAEFRQFWRNKTLVAMGTLFPIGLPLVTFVIARRDAGSTATVAATTLEMFALVALLFVQYYSVLSMVTTRRGEGVLKRLRTGEATDRQIQIAPGVPGALLTVVGSVAIAAVVYGLGAPAPVNAVPIVVAMVAGVVLFSVLALATSGITRNAEAAQITSLPVMMLAMVGLGSIRSVLPEQLSDIADRTPFAAISDLIALGSTGRTAIAPESTAVLDAAGVFGAMGAPLATLAVWTVLALALTARTFRWDDRG